MRSFFVPVMVLALGGCVTAPNAPSLTLQTAKSPQAYVQCLLPELEKHGITATVTQNSRHATVLLSSKIAADDVLEAYKSQDGTKVSLYERKPVVSAIKPSRLELAAKACQ
ncbi:MULTISPECIES: hypothetical protein [Pseudomonas]|uniref:Lipoprotein n=2 Tax=Pseudomonas poae TaxID=200451 RepID=A0AAP2WJU7_9PSED|nr:MULTISPECIES: hypothetical protein [Pseudomonas]ELQ18198.1 lipoprotein [Pseudomonas fluorescens BRIP34879]KTC41484.1 hypothetical protein AO260_32795 [Pseudomonas sp. ABAC21]AGE26184.1 lipoprotein [Pseudomonas poae RE*1-1-14]KRP49748.1 lipoprotein [Pseudomonas poae]MBC3198015.1 hypothetical protein [Pseudomonas poae]